MKFQYLCRVIPMASSESILNDYGQEGWELVHAAHALDGGGEPTVPPELNIIMKRQSA